VLRNLSKQIKRRIAYAHIAIFTMLAGGTVGIHFIEGIAWFDSFYLAVATVTTVGYGDIIPVTDEG
jgi:potassium channel subfamily K